MSRITEAFHITVDILNSFVSKWWLDAGTCLGVVREKDFLKNDNDIDVGILLPIMSLKERHEIKDMIIENFGNLELKPVKERYVQGRVVTLGFVREGVKIDLFFYHEENGFAWHYLYKKGIFYQVLFDAMLFRNLRSIRFKEKDCFLPNPPEKYLEARYGEDWRVPKSEFVYWDPNDTKAINMEFFNGKN